MSTLFLERNLQLLSDGGVLAIILPETYFHAPAGKKVRDFIYRHNIQWVIDIPHNTFRPHNNAKCIRWRSQTISDTDHNGNPIYDENKNIKDDTLLILDELNEKRKKHYTFKIKACDLKQRDILIPRYYWQTKEKELEKESQKEGVKLISLNTLFEGK